MNDFRTLSLTLSEAQTAELTALYAKMQHTMEGKYFLPSGQYDKLRAAMRDALEAQNGFIEIEKQADTHHTLLRLTIEDNRLLNLPWRLAVAQDARLYISCDVQEARESGIFQPQTASPLKILVMVSAPEGSHGGASLDYETEEKKIIEAFAPLFRHGQVQIDFTDDGSLESLEAKLKANRYHILHFSGHGIFDVEGRMGEKKPNIGYLLLEDERTLGSKLVSARAFARAISVRTDQCPDLVFLSSCQTAQGGTSEGGFTGVANKLLDVGIPAVVAMGFSILDTFASLFAAELYRQLAEKEELPQSFHFALDHLRGAEAGFAQQRGGLPSQWLIPQLYLRQQVNKLVNWTAPDQKLVFKSAKFATGEARLLLAPQPGYLFIGRRKERRDALRQLEGEGKAVLLRGMGGVGKTALAEHLLGRLVAHDPRVQPFVINEKDQSSLEALLKQMQDYLQNERRQFLIHSETARFDKAEDQLRFLLGKLDEACRPVFLFDNLESFQDGPGGAAFKAEHADIALVLDLLLQLRTFPLILTGRYRLADRPDLPEVDLNSVGRADFYKKCMQLGIKSLLQQPLPSAKRTDARPVSFDDLVDLLHQTLGGNYRALEFFDELFLAKQHEILPTLDKLEDFRKKLAEEHAPAVRDRLNTGARTLIFEELYGLLNEEAQKALHLLAGFRVPVLPMALALQGIDSDLQAALDRLQRLTLIERQVAPTDGEDLAYVYVTPLVRDFLKEQASQATFDHAGAGKYFEYVDREINYLTYADLEEAFWHYCQVRQADKVNALGETLTLFYYNKQLFHRAFCYATLAEAVCGVATNPDILIKLGMILQRYGQLDRSLLYYSNLLTHAYKTNNKDMEGAMLSNIAGIHQIRGDYDKALHYLEKSLEICKEIGDRSGEGAAFNNLSQIYYAKDDYGPALKYLEINMQLYEAVGNLPMQGTTLNNLSGIYQSQGDYEMALHYLKKSLQIMQTTGDISGEAAVLNNISGIYKVKGDYDTALQYLNQSLHIRITLGDRLQEGIVLNNIGDIYRGQGNFKIALLYLEKSLQIHKEVGSRQMEGTTLNNIGQIYDSIGNYEKALFLLEQSLLIHKEVGNLQMEGTVLNNIASIYRAKKNDELTLFYLERSLQISQKIGDRPGEGTTLNNLSLIHSGRGEFDTALEYLEQSLRISREIGDINCVAGSLHNMATIIFQQQGDPEGALPMFWEAYSIFHQMGSPNEQVPMSYINAIAEQIGAARFDEIVAGLRG